MPRKTNPTTPPETPVKPTPEQARKELDALYESLAPQLREYNQAAQKALQLSKIVWEAEIRSAFPDAEIVEMVPAARISAQEKPTKAGQLFDQVIANGVPLRDMPVKVVVFDPSTQTYQLYLK